jgi:hypothetical protein
VEETGGKDTRRFALTHQDTNVNKAPLPQSRKIEVAATLVIALLVALAAQDTVYPSAELRRTFVPNDLVNLLVGLPFLPGVLWLALARSACVATACTVAHGRAICNRRYCCDFRDGSGLLCAV